MTLVEYAKEELKIRFGYDKKDCEDGIDEYESKICDSILEVLQVIDDQNHSGLSISVMASLLPDLMMQNPITPICGYADEWVQVTRDKFYSYGDYDSDVECVIKHGYKYGYLPARGVRLDGWKIFREIYQNKRLSSLFKEVITGKENKVYHEKYYDIAAIRLIKEDGSSYTVSKEIEFPYTPSEEVLNEDDYLKGRMEDVISRRGNDRSAGGNDSQSRNEIDRLPEALRRLLEQFISGVAGIHGDRKS